MAQGPETRLVNRIMKAIHAAYPSSWVVKVAGGPYQMAGIPDLLVVIEGHLIGIEVKSPRLGESHGATLNRVTPRQAAVINALRRAGATAGVALDVESALKLIKDGLSNRA